MANLFRALRVPVRTLQGAWRRVDRSVPLLVKLALPLAAITAGGAVVVGSTLTQRTTVDYSRAYNEHVHVLAQMVAAEYRLTPNDPYRMDAFLEGLPRSSPVLQVRLYHERGGRRLLWAESTRSAEEEADAKEIVLPVGTPTSPAWLVVVTSTEQLDAVAKRARDSIVNVLLVVGLLASASTILVLYLFVLRRAGRLSRAARRAAAGDLSVRLSEGEGPRSRDVLSRVAREFDRMLRVIRTRTRELGEAEARFRALVERSPASVYVRGNAKPHAFSYVSPQSERMLGYTPEELAEAELWDRIVHPEDRSRVAYERDSAYRSGQPFRSEYRVTASDGRSVWIRDEAQLMPARDGAMEWQGILVDVTDLKEAEDARRRLSLQKQSVLESAGEGIMGMGPDGRVVFVNPAAAQMTGWSADELVGRSTHSLLHHTREDGSPYPQDDCPIYAAYTDGARHHVVGELFWRKDGSCFPVEYTSSPIFEDGMVAGAVVVFSDVTERARADDALREAYEREREAAERLRSVDVMKNAFLSAVSHELRTPLSAVLGFASTLQQQDLHLDEEDRRMMLERLAANANKLHQLLADLLDLDRTARGILEPQRSTIDVAELVLRITEESELSGHPVSVEAEPVLLEVDGAKVERIVENLLTNAAKYTPDGTAVRVLVRKEDQGVLIAVDDDGPGIPEALKEAVFEPFLRGPDAPRRAPGTGIGLSLVARFAELHGGRAWVEDRPGGGSSFRVYLPGVSPTVDPSHLAQAAAPVP